MYGKHCETRLAIWKASTWAKQRLAIYINSVKDLTKGFSSLYKHLNLRLLLTNVLNVCFRQELKHENIVSLLDFQVCTNVLL